MTDQKLNKAALEYAPIEYVKGIDIGTSSRYGFLAGVQWQAEQMKELQASLKSAVDALSDLYKIANGLHWNKDALLERQILESLSQLKAKHPEMFKG
jgi:hypothetical protein